MNILHQSSKAQDRALGVWFHEISEGRIKLPRFQRSEAWDRSRIASFLNTIIHNLPVGGTLALDVAGEEKFVSRYIKTAPEKVGVVTQHLLDGQQRLTAFWRAMQNNYEDELFFVYWPEFDETLTGATDATEADLEIRCVPRWKNKKLVAMPLWADDAAKCLSRGLLPVSLLRPIPFESEIKGWVDAATQTRKPLQTDPNAFAKYEVFAAFKDKLTRRISELRKRVEFFN